MTSKYEIRATSSELDMSGWCTEKSWNVVRDIAESLERLKKMEGSDEAQQYLCSALYDATKLLAFGAGSHWKFEDRQLVFEHGRDGAEQLAKAYGVVAETSKERRRRELEEAFTTIEGMLAGSASPNRTQLHEMLRGLRYQPQVLAHLTRFSELLEQVTQGELSWADFVDAATRELAARRGEADQSAT